MKVGIFACELDGFIPHEGMHAEHRFPVEFYEARFSLLVDEAEGVYTETLHHRKATRNGAIGHRPHDRVHRFRHHRNEVPKGIVGGGGLRNFVMRLRLD